jgi:hypothetical protein
MNNPGEFFVSISELSGKTVFLEAKISGQDELDISNLPSGIYLLKVTGDKLTSTKKLIIQ